MKNLMKCAAILAATLLAFGFASCKTNSDDDSGTVSVTSIELNKTSTSIGVGKTETLTATIKPDNASDKTVTWSSDKTDVATVDKGVVTAVSKGTATITAKAGDKTATCTVTVTVAAVIELSKITEDTTVANGFTITGTLANNVKISIADGATVTLKNASINADGTWTSGDYAGLNCLGDATITLEAGTTNAVKGFKMTYPGIHVPSGKTLTINGTGALTVSSNTSGAGQSATGAGIGGGVGLPCGNIVIAGGTITASTANDAAAIGSGGSGGGSNQTCGNISITGGTVTATCSVQHGPGIGAGRRGSCGDISITGGTVTATGASTGSCGAGIGCGGGNSTVGSITIANTVTKVTATGGVNGTWKAKSIGKGYNSTSTCVCGTITIGGEVYADGIAESPYTYPPSN